MNAKHSNHTRITKLLAASLSQTDLKRTVADVRIGLGYTAVQLEDDRTGVAVTYSGSSRGGCGVFKGPIPLAGRQVSELSTLVDSSDPIQAAVGLACINACTNTASDRYQDGDVLKHLTLHPQDHVGMVGHFAPLVEPIQKRVKQLVVFERIESPVGILRPSKEAERLLPACQVVLITATSIVNQSIDLLLRHTENCRELVMLGATTPLSDRIFDQTKFTMLSGIIVVNPRRVLQIVSEGGGMRQFGPHVQKVCIRNEPKVIK